MPTIDYIYMCVLMIVHDSVASSRMLLLRTQINRSCDQALAPHCKGRLHRQSHWSTASCRWCCMMALHPIGCTSCATRNMLFWIMTQDLPDKGENVQAGATITILLPEQSTSEKWRWSCFHFMRLHAFAENVNISQWHDMATSMVHLCLSREPQSLVAWHWEPLLQDQALWFLSWFLKQKHRVSACSPSNEEVDEMRIY